MRAWILLAVLGVGCGRLGFEPIGATSDAGLDGDGSVITGDSPDAASVPGAATVTFIGTASSVQNLTTYTFSGQPIGTPAANRIVVVCAHLGGGAVTPISSVTVNGISLTLAAPLNDTTSGAQVIAYGLVPSGTTADITVTSVAAGRAAISVLNITAMNVNTTGTGVQQTGLSSTSPISQGVFAQPGGVAIAVAGYGSNNTTWTWGGTWPSPTEHVDMVWSEQGSYTVASASFTTMALLTAAATPENATPKLLSIASWR